MEREMIVSHRLYNDEDFYISDESLIKSIQKQSGFQMIVKAFRIYGFNLNLDLNQEPNFIWVQVAFNIFLMTCGCGFSLWILKEYVSSSKLNPDVKDIFMCVLLMLITIRVFVTYVHVCCKLKRLNTFLRNLSRILGSIKPLGLRKICFQQLSRWTAMGVFFTIFTTCTGIIFSLYSVWFYQPELMAKLQADFGWIGSLTSICTFVITWQIFGNSFQFLCSVFVIVSCKMIKICFECHIPAKQLFTDNTKSSSRIPLSVGWHHFYHERLSLLVTEAEEILNAFMLTSLVEEIVIILLYSKFIHSGDWLAGFYICLKQTVIFIMTTISCSDVNDKVASSLQSSNLHSYTDLHVCTPEHVNFLTYLNQCIASRAKLTFGNVFAIHKSFLFTITGTTLTYVLILQDINFG